MLHVSHYGARLANEIIIRKQITILTFDHFRFAILTVTTLYYYYCRLGQAL